MVLLKVRQSSLAGLGRGGSLKIDWTLIYRIFFQIVLFNCACHSLSDVSSNNHCIYHLHVPLLVLHSNSLVLDDLWFYYEVIYVIFIYEFNGYAFYEMEAM